MVVQSGSRVYVGGTFTIIGGVARNNLAVAYLENKEYDKAIVHCDEAVSLGFEVAPALLDELAPHRKA